MRSDFYITGGTLPADARCYVERQADRDLLTALLDSQFCYVLDTRQVGKSSLIECTAQKLRERGVAVAKIDLTTTGKEVTAAQWYNGMLRQVADSLHTAGMPDFWDDLRGFWRENGELGPMQRWIEALRSIVLSHSDANLVIFVDEIESVRSFDFTDEFFAGIRACYNRRVDEPALRRLSFCLAGSATPDELIHSVTSTPFNIGRGITLADFTPHEAAILAAGLPDKSLLDRILYWTNGHPYLTQRLCAELTESASDDSNSSLEHLNTRTPEHLNTHTIDVLCERLFFAPEARKSEKNLAFVAKRILESPLGRAGLLDLYGKVRRGSVVNDEKDALQSTLRLAGVARARNGQLEVRNRIYERVFDPAWIRENMPDAEVRRQQTAYRRGMYRVGAMASVIIGVMGLLTFWAIRAENHANANAERADRTSYLANLNLIQNEWKTNNVSHVIELLADTKTYKNKGFEWGYWNRLCHLDLVTMKGTADSITSVAFSPDDQWVVTTESPSMQWMGDTATSGRIVPIVGGAVRLWEARTGQEMLRNHSLGDASVAFSPDSRRIVTGSRNGTVRVLDVRTGRETLTLQRYDTAVTSVAFSPDGRRIVTGSRNGGATKVWDAQTGRPVLTLSQDGPVYSLNSSVVFSPDGRRIVTGGDALRAKVWDAQTGRGILTMEWYGSSFVFSPDSRRILTFGWGLQAKVWDLQTGREPLVIQGHSDHVYSAAFSPDGRRIVMGTGSFGHSGEAIVWDGRTGHVVMTLRGHTDFVMSVAFSPDGQFIVTGSRDGTAKVWDAETGRETLTLKGHTGSITSVAFDHDGKRIATGSGDSSRRGEIKVWDAQSGQESLALMRHSSTVTAVAFSPDGKHIITGRRDKTAQMWEAETGQETFTLRGNTGSVISVAFSPDGQRIVTGSYDTTTKVWDAQTGGAILTRKGHTAPKGHTEYFTSVAFSPDGKRIVTGSDLNSQKDKVKIWNAETGREALTLMGNPGFVLSVAFSPDSRRIVTGSTDKTAKVWDAQTGQEMQTLIGHTKDVDSVAFSPDGQRIVTGSSDRTIRVWDTVTGKEVSMLKGRTPEYPTVAFSPDGQRIVTGGGGDGTSLGNGEVKVWDAQTGREILALKGYEAAVNSVAFSPDGRRIITASGNLVNVWFSDPNDWKAAMRDTMQVNAHLSQAQDLVNAQKYSKAVAEYKAVLRLRPNLGSATFLGSLGWYEYLAGHIDDAIKSSLSALEKDSTLTFIRLKLGLSYATQNDWPKAKQEYDLTLKTVSKANLKAGINDVQTAIKKRDNPTLEKALIYLQNACGK